MAQKKLLQVGDPAPDFMGIDQHQKNIQLSALKGKKIILYFYPKDNTPGCTAQACNLRDHHSALMKDGYVVLGISTDSVKSHQKFAQQFDLPFSLIADTDKKIVEAYGVYAEKTMMGKKYMGILRTTFLIDDKGIIQHIITKPNTQNHTQEIAALSF